jgi:site-specific DNA-methyltransferase (adenine-specific)
MNRIIHGDCLEELKKLPDSSIDLVCADPPYGDNTGYGRARRTIASNENPLVGLLALSASYRVLKNHRACFFFVDAKHLPLVDIFIRRYTGFALKEYLVWDKRQFGMGQGYRKQHEMIVALEKRKPSYNSAGFPNVLSISRVRTAEHPHKKPVELIKLLIKHTTAEGDTVLDPFSGSGTTALAARELGRR